MPLTAFQREVARALAAHRSPESHLAGRAVINRANDSVRYSDDLDIFHAAAASVATCAEADAAQLRTLGYSVDWIIRQVGFYRAEVRRAEGRLRLDWSHDSAFRFFPAQPDADFGYCLHPADLAANKVLALAGRTEIRDLLDVLYLDQTFLSLGAMAWAACGKDPGYTPPLLFDQMSRHVRFQQSDLQGEYLAHPVDLQELKKHWLAARDQAEALCARLPAEELGCLYLDADNRPVTPDPDSPAFPTQKRHRGSVRGAWPTFS
jgi:hypothetical protein